MDEMIKMLDMIAHSIGGEWKDHVLFENTSNNPMLDAYNEGVKAMAKQACGLIMAIRDGKILLKETKEDGCTISIEKAGDL